MLASRCSSSSPSTDVSRYLITSKGNSRDCVTEFVDVNKCMIEAKFGDLIEIDRKVSVGPFKYSHIHAYSHWAVYVATDSIIHFVNEGDGTGTVRKGSLVPETNGDKCRVNNLEKAAEKLKLVRREPNLIVSKAWELSAEYEYDIENFNCEHFVTLCAYNKAFSLQAENLIEAPTVKFIAKVAARMAR